MTKYRIVEEKYPSYSLWIPEFDRGNGWKPFTKVGRPYDRLVLSSKNEAEFHVQQDRQREELDNLKPEIIYHEI